MHETIITLIEQSDSWTLTPAERKRLSDYLQQVKATLEQARDVASQRTK